MKLPAVALALVALAVGLSGCRVTTQVSVDAGAGGHGTVAVSVSLDSSALAAVGGRSALAVGLQDTDLVAAGWVVSGPAPGPGSTTVVTARHTYNTPAEAAALVGELAGGTGHGDRPFQLTLSSHRGFWNTETSLAGRVDLSCGLSCFGDSGLSAALGSATGVDPGSLSKAAGQQPGQVFAFSVNVHLPGSVLRSDAASRRGGILQWDPQLGGSIAMSAVSRQWNWARIGAVAGVGALLIAAAVTLVIRRWRSRRRRRRHSRSNLRVGGRV